MDATTEKTPLIPDTGDDDDDTDPWKNIDLNQIPAPGDTDSTHNPFETGAASTLAGEQIPMSTRTRLPKEQGLHTEETNLSEEDSQDRKLTDIEKKAGRELTAKEKMVFEEVIHEFKLADLRKLDGRYVWAPRAGIEGGGGEVIEVKMRNKDKWYRLHTKSAGDTDKPFNESIPNNIRTALGKTLTDQVDVTKTSLDTNKKELAAKQKQLKQEQQRAAESQKLKSDMDAVRNRIKDVADQIRKLGDAHGSLDEERIQKLKDEKRALESDHQSQRQQLSQLQKAAKQADALQKDIGKLKRDGRRLTELLAELKTKEHARKPLDELKQKAAELDQQITEDLRIIEDENTSPSDREAARERLAVRNEELEALSEEIQVRERQRPLLERVKEIFKKYGWTLQAVVLAVGVVLSALALAGLNGIKAGNKAVGQGLKTIGQKLGSLLPGLIGSIVSFIFKAAGQVLSFLGEHAWLLILAVVAFFMERLLKKRRT